ncbi:MAG TPA: teichoic acid ABC transporter ATP-binding protein [Anaerolineaceae bacterium]|jgi:ABC-2 type transport system ATP-binding protein/lipopolysaccharide transport system ATP-binding protein|nr:teichoic acid ABC transporter ATP-binding protein [Anaerolineaceae bacterium]
MTREPQPDSAIFLNNISVRYRIPTEAIHTFKEYMIKLLKREIDHKSFSALKEINLDIKRGEIFGIIGRNGAGKSTLMKVISKVLIPTDGRVWVKGHVSPLLQLGAGFHPELTGRENIYLNATLLGHSHAEIENKLDEIIEFAEIGNFMEAPLRTYSSGMQSRLGFAVATAWQPDILILDEVLSVGDAAFQKKCIHRMGKFRDSGATVLMVSHSIDQVREICERALWLNKGQIESLGAADEVCTKYQNAMTS